MFKWKKFVPNTFSAFWLKVVTSWSVSIVRAILGLVFWLLDGLIVSFAMLNSVYQHPQHVTWFKGYIWCESACSSCNEFVKQIHESVAWMSSTTSFIPSHQISFTQAPPCKRSFHITKFKYQVCRLMAITNIKVVLYQSILLSERHSYLSNRFLT